LAAVALMIFHRVFITLWAFGFLPISVSDTTNISSVIFTLLSFVVCIAAWQMKKMSENYHLMQVETARKFADEVKRAELEDTARRGRGGSSEAYSELLVSIIPLIQLFDPVDFPTHDKLHPLAWLSITYLFSLLGRHLVAQHINRNMTLAFPAEF